MYLLNNPLVCKNQQDENIYDDVEEVRKSYLTEVFAHQEDKLVFEQGEENYDINKVTRAANFCIIGKNEEIIKKKEKDENQRLALSSLIDVMKSNDPSQIYETEIHN
jgi:hypothetical protein